MSSAINHARTELDWDIPNPVTGKALAEPEGRDIHLLLAQLTALIRTAQFKYPHLTDFIELAVQTGRRKQAILGLEWERVDVTGELFYPQGQHKKRGKSPCRYSFQSKYLTSSI